MREMESTQNFRGQAELRLDLALQVSDPGDTEPRHAPPTQIHGFLLSIHLKCFTMSYPRYAEIYGEEEPAKYVYKVLRGVVQTYRSFENGRRQIAAFYLPGDIFELETRDTHKLSAEAVADSEL